MRQLISKLIAAAISAAVVLLWWPIIMSSDGPASWALRAVAWTLLFELVVALLGPIEESIWDKHVSARRVVAKFSDARERVFAAENGGAKLVASRVAVLALVAAIPLSLVAGGPPPAKQAPTVIKRQGTTKIIRITKIVRVKEGAAGGTKAPAPADTKSEKRAAAHKPAKRKSTTPKATEPKVSQPAEPSAPVSAPDEAAAPVATAPPANG